MSWYQDVAFPKLMQWNIGKKSILKKRTALLKHAYGNILEIGIGEGTNLPLYPTEITHITAVDAYPRKLRDSTVKAMLFAGSADALPFDANTFDTIVSTFCLCSVKDLDQVCREIYRVLKPGGAFLFLEHGRAGSPFFQNVQHLFNPLYNKFAYGCNITRTYQDEIQSSGLQIVNLQITHAPIYPRFLTGYVYSGIAEKPTQEKKL
ncbi:class I SAM-dependent methyltransferase [Eubacterium limosum]|uniref:class I SAM-dependent methyltransferase n=1 Tax=Eubacterium limosum TaxID=1736 RepID=UPI001D0705F5|nr:class I SAM-dependent methyltransferase [Eubacterium limosum]MCB6570568.1 class I SAM-dependent methyltransferase [Eubacterium limosum]